MIVQLGTRAQAAKVAELTGGTQLAGKPNPDGSTPLSRCVDIGSDFEDHRAAVESVSVLFELYAGDAEGFIATGELGTRLPTGWTVTAAKFEVEWPGEADRCAAVRSNSVLGARRSTGVWHR